MNLAAALSLSCILAFLFSYGSNLILLKYLRKKNVLDIPNERSSHKIPTPRGGGIGIALAITLVGSIYMISAGGMSELKILLIASGIAFLGWLDDFRGGLSSAIRFGVQFLLALLVIYLFGPITKLPLPAPLDVHLGILSYPISIIWLVGITNIYNFMDGIDGIAGTQGVVVGLGLALMFPLTPLAPIGLIIAAACLGFLIVNWHPAKIFMGDVGSAYLGFLLAALPFTFSDFAEPRESVFFYDAIFLWIFLLDGTFTMIRRLLKGEKIWKPHRSHIYQRFNIAGWKHSTIVTFIAMIYFAIFLGIYFLNLLDSKSLSWTLLLIAFIGFLVYVFICIAEERKAARADKL